MLAFGPEPPPGASTAERAVRLTLAQRRLGAVAFGRAEAVDAACDAGAAVVLEPLPANARLALALPGPDRSCCARRRPKTRRGAAPRQAALNRPAYRDVSRRR